LRTRFVDLKFAAFDPRVKAFAGIAGAYNTPYAMRSGMGGDGYRQVLTSLAIAAEAHDRGSQAQYLPAVAAEGEAAADGNLLFVVRADGRLAPVTQSGPPESQAGDTMVMLGQA